MTSSNVFNVWLVAHINPSLVLLTIMMAQISSDLHWVGIKLKTTQLRIFYTAIKMRIMLELPTENGQSQVLFVLCLVFLSSGKYRFDQL